MEQRCQKCGGRLDREEIIHNARLCSLCRDPLKGQDYVTTFVGLVAGALVCTMAFKSPVGGLVGAVVGALLGRVVQKYLDAKRKLELIKHADEARLSLPEIERKRKLEEETKTSRD